METVFLIFLALAIVTPLARSSIKVINEYQRGVVFRLGRYSGIVGPGLVVVIPVIDYLRIIDMRVTVADVPEQRALTKDNVEVTVDAVVYYRVVDPEKAVTSVEDFQEAVRLLAQTTLREVIGQVELDELLSKRQELNLKMQEAMDEITEKWGIKVVRVTIKEIKLPEELLRAIAKQAEAERWRRAKIIEAEGEKQASSLLTEAAKLYEEHPVALRLRELQMLLEIAKEKNLIVIERGDGIGLPVALAKGVSNPSTEEKRT
nr:slipin family protein [Ignicoccus islandicus]